MNSPWNTFGPRDAWGWNLVHAFARAPLAQTFSALYWLGRLFDELPRLQCCLELGTLYGALSTFFGLSFPRRVLTADFIDHRSPITRNLHDLLGVEFALCDVLRPDSPQILFDLCRSKIGYANGAALFLFCDNGGKEQEFLSFVPHLRSGDVVAAHDLGTEFHPERPEIADMIAQRQMIPWRPNDLAADSTYVGVWEIP